MIVLLFAALLCRDEVADQLARLRVTTDLSQQYQITGMLYGLVKPAHVPLLVREADAGPAALRLQFIRLLGRCGSKDAQGALRGLCQRHDLASRAEAASTLMSYFEDDTGMRMLVALLPKADTAEDKQVILSRLYGFSAEFPEVVPALVRFLEKEKEEGLRRQALRSLASHKEASTLPALKKIAGDAGDALRFEALAELLRRGDESALEEGLQALEKGKVDAQGVFALLTAIESANKKSVLPRLRELAEKSSDRTLKLAVIRTLATMKDDKALPLLTRLTEDADPSVAKVALESVVRLAGRAQMELLKKTASEGDSLKRIEAAQALLQLDLREGLEGLKAVLEDKNAANRSSALSALLSYRRREAVDLLLPLMDDAQDYVRNMARQGVLSTLGALYPYLRFDRQASPEKLRAWWEKHRKDLP